MNAMTWIEIAALTTLANGVVFWLARGFVRELHLMTVAAERTHPGG